MSWTGESSFSVGPGHSQSCMMEFLEEAMVVECISDSDWAGCKTLRRSTSSGIICVGQNVLFQYVRSQRTTALSSCESEYLAMASVVSEGILVGKVLSFLAGRERSLVARCDSSSARSLAMRSGVGRIRHLSARVMWVQELTRSGLLQVRSIPTLVNPADVGTKPLTAKRIAVLANLIGLVDKDETPLGIEEALEVKEKMEHKKLIRMVVRTAEHEAHEVRQVAAGARSNGNIPTSARTMLMSILCSLLVRDSAGQTCVEHQEKPQKPWL